MSKPARKDSFGSLIGSFNDDFLATFGIAHTPPPISASMDVPIKRTRTGSISGRLRSASDLEEKGFIDRYQKGILKDLIISGDPRLHAALDKYENGDPTDLEALMEGGVLDQRSSLDLLEELDLGFLNVGSLEQSPKAPGGFLDSDSQSGKAFDDFDDMNFDAAFSYYDGSLAGSIGSVGSSGGHKSASHRQGSFMDPSSLASSLPTVGMGVTPPHPFNLADQFLPYKIDNLSPDGTRKTDSHGRELDGRTSASKSAMLGSTGAHPSLSGSSALDGGQATSAPIGIPGAPSDDDQKRFVGAYSPESRRKRIEKFLEKRKHRVWTKKVKYDVRKNFADSRLRVKGRFVRKEDEELLRELLAMT